MGCGHIGCAPCLRFVMGALDGAKRRKPAAPPPHLRHKRRGGAYVADVVSLGELLRFVHSSGRGGAAVEWIASRQLALITVPQLHVEKEEEA